MTSRTVERRYRRRADAWSSRFRVSGRPRLAHPLVDDRPRRACRSRCVRRVVLGSTPKLCLTPARSISTDADRTRDRGRSGRRGASRTARDRGDLGEDVEVGGERRDRAVQEHHVLDVQHQLLRHARAVPEQRLDDPLHLLEDLLAGERGRIDQRLVEPEVADHRPQVGVGRQRAEVAQRRHLRLQVVRRRADHQPQERLAALLAEPADDPVVEQPGATVGQHEQIAAVEVAVEDAGDHRPLHERHHRRANDAFGVDAGRPHAGDVVELEPVEALHHEHPPRDERGMRAGHDVAGLPEVVQHRRDVEHVGGLDPEVELLDDRVGEQLDERRWVRQRGHRDAPDRGAARSRPSPAGPGGPAGRRRGVAP